MIMTETGGSIRYVSGFWEIVSEYDQELKARLLQFETGTSGVPAKGLAPCRVTVGMCENLPLQ